MEIRWRNSWRSGGPLVEEVVEAFWKAGGGTAGGLVWEPVEILVGASSQPDRTGSVCQ